MMAAPTHCDSPMSSLHNAVHNVSEFASTNEINQLVINDGCHNSGYPTNGHNQDGQWREAVKSGSERCDYDPIRDREGRMPSIIAMLAVVAVLSIMLAVSDLGNWLYVLMG